MNDNNQPDLFAARAARDEALAQVTEHAGRWMDRALAVIAAMPPGATHIGETIRLEVRAAIGPPHHHNAHGALVRTALAHGLIAPTGVYTQMRTKRSHARRTPVYVVTRR